jgi:hypothetical protein
MCQCDIVVPFDFFLGYFNYKTNSTEIGCDQKVMDLPPVTSAVFLIAKSIW